jgi:hypothetical protein
LRVASPLIRGLRPPAWPAIFFGMLLRIRPLGSFSVRTRAAVFALLMVGAGCKPTDLMTAPIAADDSTTFYRWKRDTGSKLSPEQQRQLDLTVEEIRLDVMLRKEASGKEGIEAAVCARLNHVALKDALLLGAKLKWQREAAERDDLQRVANANAHLITKPGDSAAAADLEQYRAKFQKRIDALTLDLQSLEKEIKALGGEAPTLALASPATKPVDVSREEALKQIDQMLQGRRGAAVLKFGAWPVKIDWEGKQLEGEKLAEFTAKKVVNSGGDSVVVPIRIKRNWLLYEGPNEAPGLPADVKAKLTAAELAAFKKDWIELEAELWARKIAENLVAPTTATEPEDAPDLKPALPRK